MRLALAFLPGDPCPGCIVCRPAQAAGALASPSAAAPDAASARAGPPRLLGWQRYLAYVPKEATVVRPAEEVILHFGEVLLSSGGI